MEVVFPDCCGLDIHKNTITACVLLSAGSRKQKHLQRFGTVTSELGSLAAWLHKLGVVQVAMESTGVYWKPIWNILEGEFKLFLVNAQHVKNVPGRKTDLKDCEWIAELLQHAWAASYTKRTYLAGASGEAERLFRREAERHSGMIPNTIGA